LEEGGIAIVTEDFSNENYKGKKVYIHNVSRGVAFEVGRYGNDMHYIKTLIHSKDSLIPFKTRAQVEFEVKSGKTGFQLLAGGRGKGRGRSKGRSRGTRKHRTRRANVRRRLTRNVKKRRGGRGGKIYKKTKKHGRGGRRGRRRTIKKYHRR
jgi:hypothetical protein